MSKRPRVTIVARDIADPVYGVGELGSTFRQVRWSVGPPVYVEESDNWVLVEQDGTPRGIIFLDDSQYLGKAADEVLTEDGLLPISPSEIIGVNTPFSDLLTLFASRSSREYLLLDGSRITHCLADWHLSRTPARLALLQPCLDLDAALEALMMLAPGNYLDDKARATFHQRVGDWGYDASGAESDRILVRCAGLRDKWRLIRKHPNVVVEALDFIVPDGVDKTPDGIDQLLFKIANFRDGLVHGHAVLPLSPFASLRNPVPNERHRRAAKELVSLMTIIDHLIDSIERFVRRRTPKWEGGEFDPVSPPR